MGPTISFKGLEQRRLLPARTRPSRQYYMDYSGCGNTVNATTRSSRSSSSTACTTGSRRCTSTASASTRARSSHRGDDGAPMEYPPVVWHIELSETLADTKIIAEAWDAGGLYQVG